MACMFVDKMLVAPATMQDAVQVRGQDARCACDFTKPSMDVVMNANFDMNGISSEACSRKLGSSFST